MRQRHRKSASDEPRRALDSENIDRGYGNAYVFGSRRPSAVEDSVDGKPIHFFMAFQMSVTSSNSGTLPGTRLIIIS
jgi:hypothetical protein